MCAYFFGHVYVLMGAHFNKLVLDIGDLGGRALQPYLNEVVSYLTLNVKLHMEVSQ